MEMSEQIEAAQQSVELYNETIGILSDIESQKLYNLHILHRVKDCISPTVTQMAITAWEDEYLQVADYIRAKRGL
jgi:hemoglobin-like flavoprotein